MTYRSLSARRAWIEMVYYLVVLRRCYVALRKESVDRNPKKGQTNNKVSVALRKESVDRNLKRLKIMKNRRSRSPQGERG